MGTMGYGASIPLEWRSAAPGDAQVARATPEDLRRLRVGYVGCARAISGLESNIQHTILVHISRQANLIEIANNEQI
jgi:hypothetical protein